MQPALNRLIRYILFFVVAAATLYFCYLIKEVLFVFFIGALLAYLFFRPVCWIEKKGIKRAWAIVILYILTAGIIGLALFYAIPAIVGEITDLVQMYPDYAREVQEIKKKLDGVPKPAELDQIIKQNLEKIEGIIIRGMENFLEGLYSFMGKIFAVIFSPILAFYILNDWEKIRDAFLDKLSPGLRRELKTVLAQADSVLIEFLKGHLMVAVLVGIMVGVSAAILGVKFPVLLGILSGVTNLIPYFGAFLGGIPAVGLAFTESLRLAVYMAIAIFVIQQIEGNIITPRIMGGKLGMNPLLIILALLAGGDLFGIWGMIFAVPVTAVLKVIMGWAYLKIVEK